MIIKEIDLTDFRPEPAKPLDGFGGSNGRESFAVTHQCILRNGKACFPLMGEFHYSRYPAEYWEESLLKIRAGGIGVVSTYVFWIHHEEERGKFDWSGNRNLRRFLTLCGRHGLNVMLRIGPWVHGECRNGGFPDWLVNLGIPLRENNEAYLSLVRGYYREIYRQTEGLLFFDGGPITGVQIENEYGHCGGLRGAAGKEHIRTLKRIAVDTGFRVPFYTATGWGGGVVAEGDTLPVLGGYAEAPWEQHIRERKAEPGYLFRAAQTDTDIGTDLSSSSSEEVSYDVTRFPYLTAEIGAGLEPTHHRRPIISGDDTCALTMAFLGSGAALLGYYMYHGGTNPVGWFSTMQESRKTGSLNDYPELSYDFQAPIGEYGELGEAYGRLKALHLFLNDFCEEMAESSCCFPKDNPQNAEDIQSLRYCVRFGEKGGFLFLNNYQRRREMTEKEVCVDVRSDGWNSRFEDVRLKNGDYFIFPFHLNLGGLTLFSATAQLLCRLEGKKGSTYVFFCSPTEPARYRFWSEEIRQIPPQTACFQPEKEICEIRIGADQFRKAVPILLKSGKTVTILTVSREDAYRAWKLRGAKKDHLILSDACLYRGGKTIYLTSDRQELRLSAYPELPAMTLSGGSAESIGKSGDCSDYRLTFVPPNRPASVGKIRRRSYAGEISCEFSISMAEGKNIADTFLLVRFEGDCARLFIDGKLCADQFYSGTDWKIGLRRFGDLTGKKLEIQITALHADDFVFLEKEPEYRQNAVCSLQSLSCVTVYRAVWKRAGY